MDRGVWQGHIGLQTVGHARETQHTGTLHRPGTVEGAGSTLRNKTVQTPGNA